MNKLQKSNATKMSAVGQLIPDDLIYLTNGDENELFGLNCLFRFLFTLSGNQDKDFSAFVMKEMEFNVHFSYHST